ncbi:MAG: YebC/PmpR family DNA-binding transcriptional regulator [bacterium]
MSGHSKWHNIQARKGKQDAKRSGMFSKISKMITVAVRSGGGDMDTNFSLRLAIDRAKAGGFPKDNIDRAIKSGTGELKGNQIEEVSYECYGPGGVAILVKGFTDNKNRTVSDIKHILSKNGGSMGGSGSVIWMFDQRGVVVVDKGKISDREEFELEMMDAGAEEIQDIEDNKIKIDTKIENLKMALDKLKNLVIESEESGMEWVAKDKVKVGSDVESKLNNLFEHLTDHDDVEDFYTNAE